MSSDLARGYRSLLAGLVEASRRAAIWIVGAVFGLTALLLVYIPTHLSLDTDPVNLLDPNLSFRQLKSDFARTFPQLTKIILVVVDAESPDQAEGAADQLAEKLSQEPDRFVSVYQPGQEPFFKRQGLLYMKTGDLLKLDERLAQWAPFLAAVFRDPSLRGLFSMLGPALEKSRRLAQDPSLGDVFSMVDSPSESAFNVENQARLTQMLDWIGETITAQRSHQPTPRFWRENILEGLDARGNASRRLLLVKPHFDYSGLRAVEGPLHVLRRSAEGIAEQHGVRVRLTGEVVLQEEERETVGKGAGLAAMLAFSLVCLILLLGLRSPRLAGSIGVTLLVGLVWTAGFATFAIGTLNMISATAPVLFIGLGVDFGIQFGMRYKEAREKGASHPVALQETATGVGGALSLAAIAAAVSFLSFLPTQYRGLAELGLIAGGGMFIALLANLTLLPALLTVFPIRLAPGRHSYPRRALHPVILNQRKVILVCAVVLLATSAAFLPQVDFDFNPLHLKDPSSEGVAIFKELLRDPNSSPYNIEILSKDLATAQDLTVPLEKLEEVEKTITLASFIPHNQEDKLAIVEEMVFTLEPIILSPTSVPPPSHEENARAIRTFQGKLAVHRADALGETLASSMNRLSRLLDDLQAAPGWPNAVLPELQKRLLDRLPSVRKQLHHLLMAGPIELSDLPSSLKERYLAPDGRARLVVFPSQDMSDNQALREFTRAVQSIAPDAFGMPVGLLDGGDAVVRSCVQATGFALLGVTLLLWFVLRRIGDVALVLLPLVLTVTLTLAASVAVRLPLNLANVIALPLVLGLGIAFGIYLVLRAREGVSSGSLAHTSTFRAVWYSALTTIASFGSLAIAEYRGMSSMGQLLILSLAITLLCALAILPAVMAELESRGLWTPASVHGLGNGKDVSDSSSHAHE